MRALNQRMRPDYIDEQPGSHWSQQNQNQLGSGSGVLGGIGGGLVVNHANINNGDMDFANHQQHENIGSGQNGPIQPGRSQYTIPGILQFIQSEWAKFELERAQHKVEKAELTAQIAFLQGEQKGQNNLRRDLIRRIKMLEFALKQERQRYYELKTGHKLDLDGTGSQGGSSASESSSAPSSPKNSDAEGDPTEKPPRKIKKQKKEKPRGHQEVGVVDPTTAQDDAPHAATADPGSDDENRNPNQFYWKHGRQLLRQYLEEVGYTDTILNVRAKRLRTLLTNADSGSIGQQNMPLGNRGAGESELVGSDGLDKGEMASAGDFNHLENVATMKKRKGSASSDDPKLWEGVDQGIVQQKIDAFKSDQNTHRVHQSQANAALRRIQALDQNNSGNFNNMMEHQQQQHQQQQSGEEQHHEWWNASGNREANPPSGNNWIQQNMDENNFYRKLPGNVGGNKLGELSNIRVENDIDGINAMGTTHGGQMHDGPGVGGSNKLFDQVINTITQNGVHGSGGGQDGDMYAPSGGSAALGIQARLQQDLGQQQVAPNQYIPKFALRGHYDTIRDFALHPTENVVLSASDDGTLKLWNLIGANESSSNRKLTDCDPVYTFRMHKSPVLSCAFSHRGYQNQAPIATCSFSGCADGQLFCYNTPSINSDLVSSFDPRHTIRCELTGHDDAVWSLDWNQDHSLLASASADGSVMIWNPANADKFYEMGGLESSQMESSEDYTISARFERGEDDDTIRSLCSKSASSGEDEGKPENSDAAVAEMRAEADRWMRWPQIKCTLKISEAGCGETNSANVYVTPNRVVWLNSTTLIVSYTDGTIRLYDVNAEKSTQMITSHTTWGNSFSHLEEGILAKPRDIINSISACAQLNYIAAAYEDHYARIFDINSNKLVSSIVAHTDSATSISIDHQGLNFATGSAGSTIRVWSLESKQCTQEIPQAHHQRLDESITAVKFHPQRPRTLGSCGVDAIVKMYHC